MKIIIKRRGESETIKIKEAEEAVILREEGETLGTAITPEAVVGTEIQSTAEHAASFPLAKRVAQFDKLPSLRGKCEDSFYIFGCRQNLKEVD